MDENVAFLLRMTFLVVWTFALYITFYMTVYENFTAAVSRNSSKLEMTIFVFLFSGSCCIVSAVPLFNSKSVLTKLYDVLFAKSSQPNRRPETKKNSINRALLSLSAFVTNLVIIWFNLYFYLFYKEYYEAKHFSMLKLICYGVVALFGILLAIISFIDLVYILFCGSTNQYGPIESEAQLGIELQNKTSQGSTAVEQSANKQQNDRESQRDLVIGSEEQPEYMHEDVQNGEIGSPADGKVVRVDSTDTNPADNQNETDDEQDAKSTCSSVQGGKNPAGPKPQEETVPKTVSPSEIASPPKGNDDADASTLDNSNSDAEQTKAEESEKSNQTLPSVAKETIV